MPSVVKRRWRASPCSGTLGGGKRSGRGFVADEYHAREECKQSGVYRAVHEPQHTPDHDVTVLFGHIFPRCSHHGCNPKFVLVAPGQNVNSNNWFK